MAICSSCGCTFDLAQAKSEFNRKVDGVSYGFLFSDPMCIDCALNHVYQTFIDVEEYEDIYEEMKRNPTGEYYSV